MTLEICNAGKMSGFIRNRKKSCTWEWVNTGCFWIDGYRMVVKYCIRYASVFNLFYVDK